jgi:ectoine hydroxylase-related dioxygenase (phytanoyl-CoA dioxygenase family)
VVPGSHRDQDEAAVPAIVLSGKAGDAVAFDFNVLHGATSNSSGALRRSLLVSYADLRLREELRATRDIRGVRMDDSEVFPAPA